MTNHRWAMTWRPFALTAVHACGLVCSALATPTSTSRAKFPANQKLSSAKASDYKPWIEGVVLYTFGAGLGLMCVLWMLMACCGCINCCRGPGRKDTRTWIQENGVLMRHIRKLDRKSGSITSLLVGLFVIFCAHVLLGAMVYYEAHTAANHLFDFYDGTQSLIGDVGTALCSENTKDAPYTSCDSKSVGLYLYTLTDKLDAQFDQAVTWLGTLYYVSSNISAVNASLVRLTQAVNAVEVSLERFEGNNTEVFTILTAMQNPDNVGGVTISGVKTNGLPNQLLLSSQMYVVQRGLNNMITTIAQVQSIMAEVQGTIENNISSVESELADGGSVRTAVDEQLNILLRDVTRLNNYVITAKHTTTNFETTGQTYVWYVDMVITLLFFLPAASVLVYGCITWRTKSGTPMRCEMLTTFCCQQWCSLITGMIMLISVMTSDFCTYHMEVLVTNSDYNITVGTVSVNIAHVLQNLLRCSGSQNYVTILGVVDQFNLTKQVEIAFQNVYSSLDSFESQLSAVNSVYAQTTWVVSNITFLSFSYDLDQTITSTKKIQSYLPPSNMDRDNETSQSELFYTYSSNTQVNSIYSFDWRPSIGTYRTQLAIVNVQLGLMTSLPAGYPRVQNFTSIVYLNRSAITDPYGPWYDGNNDGIADNKDRNGNTARYGATNYTTVKHAVLVCDTSTRNVTAAIKMNNYVQYNLSRALQDLENMQVLEKRLQIEQNLVGVRYSNAQSSIYSLMSSLDWAVNGLRNLLDGIQNLITYVLTAPDYLQCAYLGTFYRESIQGYLCTDIEYDLSVWCIPTLLGVLLMLCTFYFVGYYTPYMKASDTSCKSCCGSCAKTQPPTNEDSDDVELLGVGIGIQLHHDAELVSVQPHHAAELDAKIDNSLL